MHLIFNVKDRLLKVYEQDGTEKFYCEARNDAIGSGYHHDGKCPPGNYGIGAPQKIDPPEVAYGFYFTPLEDTDGNWKVEGRAGIGMHGGGSGLGDPFAKRQGWVPTCGCIRLQNEDNELLVRMIYAARITNEKVRITVSP